MGGSRDLDVSPCLICKLLIPLAGTGESPLDFD
jgi:hypothetical protein